MVRFSLLLLLCFSGFAAAKGSVAALIEREERQLAESLGKNDTSVLERIFAPDCLWVLPDGTILDKPQAISAISSGSAYSLLRNKSVSVRVFGTTAVAHGTDEWQRGQEHGTFSWTSTWLLRNGRWQIVQVQDTEHRR